MAMIRPLGAGTASMAEISVTARAAMLRASIERRSGCAPAATSTVIIMIIVLDQSVQRAMGPV